MNVVRVGWVAMAMVATAASAIGTYRFFTLTCEWCGFGTFVVVVVCWIAAMVCMALAEDVRRSRK